MIRLLVSELRRVAARRLVRLTFALSLVGIALGGVAAFAFSDSLTEQEYQQRVVEAKERERAQQVEIEACLQANGIRGDVEIPNDVADKCFPEDFPRAEDPRFHRTKLEGILQGVSGALAVIGWALGASLVGAEFASRGMTTLLTWENRRIRVIITKAVAAIGVSALLALVAMVLVSLAMWPSLALHGAPLRPDDPSLVSLAGIAGRGIALTAVASAVGFAIATVGRSTAAALGAGFAYVIVLENILGSFVERWRRWLLLGNVIVFVGGKDNGGDIPGRTVVGAGLFLTAVAVTLLVVAGATFRSRDLA